MANVLLTGGTGFIGRELIAQLVARGDSVVSFSRRKPTLDVQWIEGDITSAKELGLQLKHVDPEVIYHLGSLPGDTGNPQQMIDVNITGLTNMLEFARNRGVKRFVLASSISAYEWFPATKFRPPLEMPVTEEHVCRPQDIYASSKRMQEILAETYYHQYSVPTTTLRVTAVIGPHGSGGGTMWREFAEQLQRGDKVQLPMFSANELSHFVDLRDVAQMHIVAAEHPNAVGQIFNCCSAHATRGLEFAEIVEQLVPSAQAVFGFPWSMAQGGEIEFSMAKMKSLLDHEPHYTLHDAIQSIFDWVQAGGLET